MTSIREERPLVVGERTAITVPVLAAFGGLLLGAAMWANGQSVATANLQRDRENDRERLQRIERALERIENRLDVAIRDKPVGPER